MPLQAGEYSKAESEGPPATRAKRILQNGGSFRYAFPAPPVARLHPVSSRSYFRTVHPASHRHGSKWALLRPQVREGSSGQEVVEGEEHLSECHLHEITKRDGHFDQIETTVSHLFREPSEALQGLTY